MLRSKKSFISKITNSQLSTKIVCIILIVVFLMISASVSGILLVLNSSNKLLYQALAGSLTYSSQDISKKLSNIESMTSAVVSNSNIRKNLITLAEEDPDIRIKNAENSLNTLIADYYQTYKDNNISYINLYHAQGATQSYEARSSQVPDAVHQNVVKAANNNSGYPYWVTDYCNSYGLFLGRECRRVDQMNFQTLGTVVVGVDMDRLVRSSTNSVLHSDETQYILFDTDTEFYHSESLDSDEINTIGKKLKTDYGVISVNAGKYFAVKGSIGNTSWNYICLVPYGHISATLNFTKLMALVVILVSVLISLLLSRMLIRSVTSDFSRLIQKMKAFGRDESTPPDTGYDYSGRTDEVGVLHNQFDHMALKIQNLIQENYVNEILSKDARLKALENQINPHFLYNTLEAVNWRAKAIGEKDISSMVEALGTLMRETLNTKDKTFTVRRELEIVKSYLTIQQIRFEDRLEYTKQIDDSIMDISLPHLTIQPLVENAVIHGLEPKEEGGTLILDVRKTGNYIRIRICDNGMGIEKERLERIRRRLSEKQPERIGVWNIWQRLSLYTGRDDSLKIMSKKGAGTIVSIYLHRGEEDV